LIMNNFNYALIIRESLSVEQVLESYGVAFNRAGFALCPFHSEHTASLRVRNASTWHCFGCGKGGDVIDFVIEYFGLGWREAISKINVDFALNLPIDRKVTLAESLQVSKRIRELAAERACKQAEYEAINEAYETLLDEYARLDCNLMRMKPAPGETELNPLFTEAICKIQYYKWLLQITPLPDTRA